MAMYTLNSHQMPLEKVLGFGELLDIPVLRSLIAELGHNLGVLLLPLLRDERVQDLNVHDLGHQFGEGSVALSGEIRGVILISVHF